MTNYQIVLDEKVLDAFISDLPTLESDEVWYMCLFGRHKYDPGFPNTRDSGQLARCHASSKRELKDKLRRLECPVGAFSRDGAVASQQCLAVYMSLNPRSLITANKGVLREMVKRITDGQMDFNPVSIANTEIHRAVGRKFMVDFDFDNVSPEEHKSDLEKILPDPYMYKILMTRGGFHLLVDLDKIRGLHNKWHSQIASMPGCDVKGTNSLTPVPGCTQGGFSPYFMEQ